VDLPRAPRALWVAALLLVVCGGGVMAAAAPGASFLTFGAAFLGGLVCGLAFLVGWICGDADVARGALLLLSACVLAVIAGGLGHRHLVDVSRARGDAIAQALESYAQREGQSPPALELLVPTDLDDVPATPFGMLHPMRFHYTAAGGDYHLSFKVDPLGREQRTATKSWRYWD
jgi:hypothetical protein